MALQRKLSLILSQISTLELQGMTAAACLTGQQLSPGMKALRVSITRSHPHKTVMSVYRLYVIQQRASMRPTADDYVLALYSTVQESRQLMPDAEVHNIAISTVRCSMQFLIK